MLVKSTNAISLQMEMAGVQTPRTKSVARPTNASQGLVLMMAALPIYVLTQTLAFHVMMALQLVTRALIALQAFARLTAMTQTCLARAIFKLVIQVLDSALQSAALRKLLMSIVPQNCVVTKVIRVSALYVLLIQKPKLKPALRAITAKNLMEFALKAAVVVILNARSLSNATLIENVRL
jgi:hypothetical protein